MTQRPTGEVVLRNRDGEQVQELDRENLYARTVAAFERAIRGEGLPTSTGEDGARSLAAALAVLEAARTGRRVPVRFD
jgi:1,5-anhydro-D-fructose reductase (1,5-anhydro-D-mannitol-forming)